jgi:PKD repeat protein
VSRSTSIRTVLVDSSPKISGPGWVLLLAVALLMLIPTFVPSVREGSNAPASIAAFKGSPSPTALVGPPAYGEGSTSDQNAGVGSATRHAASPPAPLPGAWTLESPANTPPSTQSGGMIYDPVAGEFVLFGGNSAGAALGDTWVYKTGQWTDLTSTLTTAPQARWYFSFVWDAADQYGLLFGGRNQTADLNDTWAFNGTWSQINTTTAPPPLTSGRTAYDAADGYVVLFGGYSIMIGAPSNYNFTWTYRAGAWTNITSTVVGAPATPQLVTYSAYDSTDGYVLLYGGSTVGNLTCGTTGDTWTYLNGTYKDLTSSAPYAPPVSLGSRMMADDPALGGVVLYGGWDGGYCAYSNETWEYRAGTWYDENLTDNPGPLWDAPTAGDGPNGSVLLFSGNTVPNTSTQSTETWNLTPALLVAIGGTTAGIVPFTVNVSSSVIGVAPFTYNWSWGDGSTDNTTANASHTYATVGTFSVSLSVSDLYGKVTVAGTKVHVYLMIGVLANSSVDAGDAPLTVEFSADVIGGVIPDRVAWSFGDGGTATTVNAAHVYESAGNFTWRLNATDSQGHRASANGTVHVVPMLVAEAVRLNATRGIEPFPVALTVTVSGGAPPYAYLWNLGDGTRATSGNATTHVYSAAGNFTGNVTITDAYAARTVQTFLVQVADPMSLQSDVTPREGVAPLLVQFQGTASGGFPPYTYAWAFDFGNAGSSGATVGYSYTAPGRYAPVLVVNDSDGHQINAQFAVTVVRSLSLMLSVTPTVPVSANPVALSIGTVGGLGPFTYEWGFGDGTSLSGGANESHTYHASGDFRVTVTVTDELGEIQTASATVQVVAPLAVAVVSNVTNVTVGQTFGLLAQVEGGLAPVTVNWTDLPAGCPTSPHTATVDCTAELTGTYDVGVWVNDSAGQTRHANTTVNILPIPPAAPVAPLSLFTLELALGFVAIAAAVVIAAVFRFRRRPATPSWEGPESGSETAELPPPPPTE